MIRKKKKSGEKKLKNDALGLLDRTHTHPAEEGGFGGEQKKKREKSKKVTDEPIGIAN